MNIIFIGNPEGITT